MKVLVLVQDYPNNNGGKKLMYVHVRNKYYMQNGIEVTVLNFSSKSEYVYEGIRVVSEKGYINENNQYDFLICHAANLKNHYRFLKKHGNKFPRFIFFFHGHEVLKISKEYPKDYPYIKKSEIKRVARDIYDELKFLVWRKYFIKVKNKTQYVFVSNWLKKKFFENLKITESDLKGRFFIINNSVGEAFEKNSYHPSGNPKYDFITIRSDLDGAKYGVDIVNELAERNPEMKFLLVGKGRFFDYNKKADNLDWIDQSLNHEKMLKLLNDSQCALMPTREDTQGVMACEMATFGMPLITSNIDVCKEIFSVYNNVTLICNENFEHINLEKTLNSISGRINPKRYCINDTMKKEIKLLKEKTFEENFI